MQGKFSINGSRFFFRGLERAGLNFTIWSNAMVNSLLRSDSRSCCALTRAKPIPEKQISDGNLHFLDRRYMKGEGMVTSSPECPRAYYRRSLAALDGKLLGFKNIYDGWITCCRLKYLVENGWFVWTNWFMINQRPWWIVLARAQHAFVSVSRRQITMNNPNW